MKHAFPIVPSLAIAVLLFVAVLMLPRRSQAQFIDVRQSVFGMDCAPCAYALEMRLNGLDGVSDATVSLNDGMTIVAMKPQNSLTLQNIREAVQSSGFSPQESVIRARGRLVRENGHWKFELPNGDLFDVRRAAASGVRRADPRSGKARIEGRVGTPDSSGEGAHELTLLATESI